MSDQEIERAQLLYEESTAGEWIVHRNHEGMPLSVAVFNQAVYDKLAPCGSSLYHDQVVGAWSAKECDLEFIAAAHQALPAALQEVRRLRQQIAEQARKWREEADKFSALARDARTHEGEDLAFVKVATLRQSAAALETLLGGTGQ